MGAAFGIAGVIAAAVCYAYLKDKLRRDQGWLARRSGSQPLAALPDKPRAKQTENRIARD